MKDYYYILGIKQTASLEEVKRAYRKLSLKFHPDTNDGDEFFTERFKELKEAYEILIDPSKRKIYDDSKNSNSDYRQSNYGPNFDPYIEYFKANTTSFEYDEEVTFSWKTINADKIILRPFGSVQAIGQRTYKLKDFKNDVMTFDLIAENSNIGRQANSSLTLKNKTYNKLYEHFKLKINNEKENKKNESQTTSQKKSNPFVYESVISYPHFILFLVIFLVLLLYLIA